MSSDISLEPVNTYPTQQLITPDAQEYMAFAVVCSLESALKSSLEYLGQRRTELIIRTEWARLTGDKSPC